VCAAAACGGGDGDRCTRDDECASGFCRADGTCAPSGDAGDVADASAADGTPSICTPDHDGMITRAEVPMAAGLGATFRIAEDATVSTAGTQMPSGMRRWDLGAALAGDADVDVVLASPAGAWWEAEFPSATYATELSAASDLLGVFALDDTRLRLLGVVSPAAGPTRTEVHYDPPVDLLQIPLATSASWSTTSTVTGQVNGVPGAYTEDYDHAVDAVGTLVTPYGEFPVVRIAVDFTQTTGVIVTRRSFAFVAECFGTVATIVSQDYESNSEFTDAAEVRRLAP
jgi:hypothetical protein